MGTIIKLVIFAIVLGIIVYQAIMIPAKRKYRKQYSEATYGKEYTEQKELKQKEKRKSFWKKVGYWALIISMGIVALVILTKHGKRKK
jgi:hypothetical protein